jgi:5-formyltetrahydrofolate cyclo-ligase
MTDVKAGKRAARDAAYARRAAAHAGNAAARADAAAARLDAALTEAPGVASGYLPFRTEIDPLPALGRLAARGARLAMPVVVGKGLPLVFRAWVPGAPTETGAFGVEIPADDIPASPDLLLVPMLAFDRRGYRLGYGGGFYDRTLAALRAAGPVRAVGIAYAAQEIPSVPHEDTDARLDMIVTEDEVIACA